MTETVFIDVPAPGGIGVDLEPLFSQMQPGTNTHLRLARGGVWSGDYLYRQGGGGFAGMHFIHPQDGTGPIPIISGTLQIGVEATPIQNITIRNLQFTGRGIKVLGSGTGLHLRKLLTTGAKQGMIVQADGALRWKNVLIDKCRVLDLDTQGSGEHGNGLYCYGCDGLSIVGNVFDRALAPLDTLSHHIYIQNGNTGVVLRRNILSRSSSHGIQARPGGFVDHNIFLDCPIGLLLGGGTAPEAGGITFNAHHNAVLGGGNIDPTGSNLPRGWAYYLENVASGSFTNNIAADGAGGDKRGLTKDCSVTGTGAPGEPDTTMVGVLNVTGTNYHRAHGTIHTDAGPLTGTTVTLGLAPNQTANLDYTYLGLTWDAIRAGTVDVLGKLTKIRNELGIRG